MFWVLLKSQIELRMILGRDWGGTWAILLRFLEVLVSFRISPDLLIELIHLIGFLAIHKGIDK